jgi:hypothetical protein
MEALISDSVLPDNQNSNINKQQCKEFLDFYFILLVFNL